MATNGTETKARKEQAVKKDYPIVSMPVDPVHVGRGRGPDFPFAMLQVGQCFYEDDPERFDSLRKSASRYNRGNKGERRVRTGLEGSRLRCWLDPEIALKPEELPSSNPTKFEFVAYLAAQLNQGLTAVMPATFKRRFDQLRGWAADWATAEKRRINTRMESDFLVFFEEGKEQKPRAKAAEVPVELTVGVPAVTSTVLAALSFPMPDENAEEEDEEGEEE